MIKITEFKIEEGIIHVLDTGCDDPILNDKYLNLSNEEINLFLTKHVEKILKDDEIYLGKFIREPYFLENVCKFLNEDFNLIDISREISKVFFDLLHEYGGGISCDLLFLKLKTEFGNALCMIKLDYTKNYIHKIDYVDEKLKIDIVPQSIALPNISQKIMKACIFVKDLDDKFNLFFIDKVYKNSTETQNYFKDEFLHCEKIHSNSSKTRDLIYAAEKWTRKNIKDDADRAFFIRESLREKLTDGENLNINSFAREVFDEKNVIENFVDFVESNGIEGDIVVDKDYVNKKYERIRLKIDKDIDLYINKDSFYDVNRFEVKRNGDGSLNIIIKYILNYYEK